MGPDLTPPLQGEYTVITRAPCVSGGKLGDDYRRRDVGFMSFGSGTPVIDTREAMDNFAELASKDARPLQSVATPAGVIQLPIGRDADVSYMPNPTTLRRLYDGDTRVSGISDRYYR